MLVLSTIFNWGPWEIDKIYVNFSWDDYIFLPVLCDDRDAECSQNGMLINNSDIVKICLLRNCGMLIFV